MTSLQTVILASNPPQMGGQVLSHCRSAWERRQICHQQRWMDEGGREGWMGLRLTNWEILIQGLLDSITFLLYPFGYPLYEIVIQKLLFT